MANELSVEEQVYSMFAEYPNLKAVFMGTVAGDFKDWPQVSRELRKFAFRQVERSLNPAPGTEEVIPKRLAPCCDEHGTGAGARSGCPYCILESMSAAFSRISYACELPNEMEVSAYDTHYNHEAVVEQVKQKLSGQSATDARAAVLKCAEICAEMQEVKDGKVPDNAWRTLGTLEISGHQFAEAIRAFAATLPEQIVDSPHVWVPPKGPIKWEHCEVCGVIKQRNGGSTVCKGRPTIGPRSTEQPADSVVVPREPVTGANYEAGLWNRRNWEAALEDQASAVPQAEQEPVADDSHRMKGEQPK